MRAHRLVSILLLLQIRRRMTARELARRLEVSERTIHRDMEALSAAGVPVYAERGARGGWVLQDGYQTNLTGLNEQEILALFAARPSRLLADLGLQHVAEAALTKVLAAIPSRSRRDAEYARQRIYVDMAGWNQAPESVGCLPILLEAIWQERKLHLTYERSDGTAVERLVDPLGLVAKGSVWYLVAGVDAEVRTYRVSRVQTAQLSDEPCIRPPNFDLAAHWAQASADFKANLPRYQARLRIAASVLPLARAVWRYARIEREEPVADDGWVTVDVRFDVEDEACAYALGFGPMVEVVEPVALRERVIDLAEQTVAVYSRRRSDMAR